VWTSRSGRVAAVIKPGHRLRVAIQSADFPHLFPSIPQLLDSAARGMWIWHDAAHPSWVTLPTQR
jgi:uncharacterized protein